MKNIIIKLVAVLSGIILSAIIGVILLCAVYLLPTNKINAHLVPSAEVLSQEGTYPTTSATGRLDNFTDSIMLLEAGHKNDGTVLKNVLLSKRYIINGKNPVETMTAIYKDDETNFSSQAYPRYWHGYLIFLKPLLCFMDYASIRVFNGIVQILLIGFTISLLFRRKLKNYVIPYILSILLLRPLGLFCSLQYSTCFYLLSAGILMSLLIKNMQKHGFYVFLILGIATAYFDFLTYPLAVFGAPAVVYLIVTNGTLKTKLLGLFETFVSWGCGYVGMWGTKWLLCDAFTEHDIITEVLKRLIMRSSISVDGGEKFNLSNAFYRNVSEFVRNPVLIVALLFVVVAIAWTVIYYKRRKISALIILKDIFPFVLLAILPFVWYAFTINHSVIHSWFTNKSLIITAFAGMCMFIPKPYEITAKTQATILNLF